MKRLALCLLAASSALTQAALAQDLPYRCSTSCTKELAREALQAKDSKAYAVASQKLTGATNPNLMAIVKSAATKFKERSDSLTGQITDLKTAQRVHEKTFAVKDDIPGSDLVPTSTFAATIDQALDHDIDVLEQRRDELAADVLAPALAELRTRHQEIIDGLAGQPPEVVQKTLFGDDGTGGLFADTEIGKKLDPDGKADLANVKGDLLQAQLKKVAEGTVATDKKVDALAADYLTFKKEVNAFKDDTKKKIASISETQNHLANAFEILGEQVGNNTYRLDALEGAMWGKLSAGEKIAVLESGAFSSVIKHMPADKKAELENDLKFAATLEEYGNAATAVGKLANDFAKIGALVGVDLSEPAARINQANTAVQSIIQIASGNPLAVISGLGGLSGLFGGGEDDSGVSTALAEIRRDIQQMRKEMYEYHVREMEALESISKQIDQRFRELVVLGVATMNQVGFVTQQLNESMSDGLSACNTVVKRWRLEPGEDFDLRAERFNKNYTQDIARCRNGIADRLFVYRGGNRLVISTVFSLQALGEVNETSELGKEILAVQRYRNETLRPTMLYTLREHPAKSQLMDCPADELAFRGLASPWEREGSISGALDNLKVSCEARKGLSQSLLGDFEFDLPRTLTEPISASSLLGHGKNILAMSRIYEFLDTPGDPAPKVMTKEELGKLSSSASNVRLELPRRQLRVLVGLLNIAIAQINALSGDAVLKVLATDIEAALDDPNLAKLTEVNAAKWSDCSASEPVSARYFNALCLLKRNEILRANFVRHWVRTRLDYNSARGRYNIGLTEPTDQLLQDTFQRKMPIERCDAEWCLKLPGANIPDPDPSAAGEDGSLATQFDLSGDFLLKLPSMDEVSTDRQASASPLLYDLLALRSQVVERLTEMDVNQILTDEERDVVNSAIVLHLAQTVDQTN